MQKREGLFDRGEVIMKKCAYCKHEKKLTIEHIFPSWIVREQPDSNARFSLNEQRVTERVPTIRDVCGDCNSGQLAYLDNYVLGLYQRYFSKSVPEKGVIFEYDYDLLARWLLKVVYNSARKTKSRPDELEEMINYILGKSPRVVNLRIIGFLLKPSKLSQRMLRKLGEDYQGPITFAPRNVSITRMSFVLQGGSIVLMGRAVLLNSYCFVIVNVPEGLDRTVRRRMMSELTDQFAKKFGDITVIDPRFKKVTLLMSNMDLIEMKRDSLTIFKDAYDDYYRRREAKKPSALTNERFATKK